MKRPVARIGRDCSKGEEIPNLGRGGREQQDLSGFPRSEGPDLTIGGRPRRAFSTACRTASSCSARRVPSVGNRRLREHARATSRRSEGRGA
eukprot:5414858-Pleurochrysis_carterae.AAC.1